MTSSTPNTAPAAPTPAADAPFLTPNRIRLFAIVGGLILVVALATWFLMTAGKRKEAGMTRIRF
jgi:hypothetical protein